MDFFLLYPPNCTLSAFLAATWIHRVTSTMDLEGRWAMNSGKAKKNSPRTMALSLVNDFHHRQVEVETAEHGDVTYPASVKRTVCKPIKIGLNAPKGNVYSIPSIFRGENISFRYHKRIWKLFSTYCLWKKSC